MSWRYYLMRASQQCRGQESAVCYPRALLYSMLPESLCVSVTSRYHTQVLLFRSAVPSLSIYFSITCRMSVIGERRDTVRRCEACREQDKGRRVSKILRACRTRRRGCEEVNSLCLERGSMVQYGKHQERAVARRSVCKSVGREQKVART